MRSDRIRALALIPLFTVLICICSMICIPFPLPFTLQTFGIFFACSFLGGKKGLLCVLLYIVLGLTGLPVFSGFGGGFGALLQPSGGFILGFLFIPLIYLIFERTAKKGTLPCALICLAGLALCYLTGTVWYTFVYLKNASASGILAALSVCVLPFIVPDIIKLVLALLLGDRIKNIVNRTPRG